MVSIIIFKYLLLNIIKYLLFISRFIFFYVAFSYFLYVACKSFQTVVILILLWKEEIKVNCK